MCIIKSHEYKLYIYIFWNTSINYYTPTSLPDFFLFSDPQKRLFWKLRQSLIRQLQKLFPSLAADQTELHLIFLRYNKPNIQSYSWQSPAIIPLLASDPRLWLQPDISAPGVEILAAYSHVASPVPPYKQENDTRRVNYAVLAGTSMACPHAAGVAAYVKTFYPEWTPSMIKSAIMTTGKNNNNAFLFHK